MDRVPGLGHVDLSAVLGISLTAEATQRLIDIGDRIDLLRLPGDELGWIIASNRGADAGGQPLPLALGTALSRHYEPGDWVELALDIWHSGGNALLVTAAVEVACFCPVDHNVHSAEDAEWTARSEGELLASLEVALGRLAAWSEDTAGPGTWRSRAHLPQP
jgi:hypothetical protein